MADAFNKLANHLDKLPGGFPATESGVEIRILKRLFTEEEALVATGLTLKPERADEISKRLQIPVHQLEPQLYEMSRKGLIFRISKAKPLYMAAQFVVGIWEYHVNDLDPDLVSDFNQYSPFLARRWAEQKTKQLRVIPVSKSLSSDLNIMPYEVAEEIIKAQSKIVVSPCICRKEQKLAGAGCNNPLEVCLIFGKSAKYYEENGLGHGIELEEALQTLDKGIEAGLVLQPGNAQRPANICMCCGCCCQVLKNLKALPEPAKAVNSSYHAVVDENACVGCGNCEDRCHMGAISLDNVARIDLKRCIGCGVCIPVCEVEAIRLTGKSSEERWTPPKSAADTYLNMAKERGLV